MLVLAVCLVAIVAIFLQIASALNQISIKSRTPWIESCNVWIESPMRFKSVFVSCLFCLICLFLLPCGTPRWLTVSFWAHVNIVTRIVSYLVWKRKTVTPDWPYCFRLSEFSRVMEWLDSKCWLWVRTLAKIGVSPLKFLGGTYEPDGVMVKALACDSRAREFNSRPFRC